MNALFLGGMSPRNKTWIREVEQKLKPLFVTTLVHDYAHWDNPDQNMDIAAELVTVAEKAEKLGQYVIFAKSIGTVLTAQGIHDGVLTPDGCLLAGLPLAIIKTDELQTGAWLTASAVPIIIVQNTNDPVGSFADAQTHLGALPPNHKLIELPGDTHDYNGLEKLKELMSQLSAG